MKALLLVDLQNDFLPGGALAVNRGQDVIPLANERMDGYPLVVATQDWHPADHLSFASQHPGKGVGDLIMLDGMEQVLWPDHCVQHTQGAEFAAELRMDKINKVVQKGTDRRIDSYSGFFDNARRKATDLELYLRQQGIKELHILGLATDYCVKATALDGIDLGFKTILLSDAVRGVELHPRDCERAIEQMRSAGVEIR